MDNTFSTILIVIAILVVVFLLLREVNCWYWKINERISLQKEQNSILNKILQEQKSEPNIEHKYSITKDNKGNVSKSSNTEDLKITIEKDDKKTISSNKTLKSFNCDKGILEIEIFEINGNPNAGDKVYLSDQPAPNGKYKIGFMWYIHVKDGVISGISYF